MCILTTDVAMFTAHPLARQVDHTITCRDDRTMSGSLKDLLLDVVCHQGNRLDEVGIDGHTLSLVTEEM